MHCRLIISLNPDVSYSIDLYLFRVINEIQRDLVVPVQQSINDSLECYAKFILSYCCIQGLFVSGYTPHCQSYFICIEINEWGFNSMLKDLFFLAFKFP